MKTIKVQYKVKPDFAEQNKTNILAVMNELEAQNKTEVTYSAYCAEDGQSFVHIYSYQKDEDEGFMPTLSAFQVFRAALKEGIVEAPTSQKLTLLAKV